MQLACLPTIQSRPSGKRGGERGLVGGLTMTDFLDNAPLAIVAFVVMLAYSDFL